MQNVANAQKEIDRLEAEADAANSTENARKATEKQQVNGSASAGAEMSQEKDATADVSKDLEKTKLEDEAA